MQSEKNSVAVLPIIVLAIFRFPCLRGRLRFVCNISLRSLRDVAAHVAFTRRTGGTPERRSTRQDWRFRVIGSRPTLKSQVSTTDPDST